MFVSHYGEFCDRQILRIGKLLGWEKKNSPFSNPVSSSCIMDSLKTDPLLLIQPDFFSSAHTLYWTLSCNHLKLFFSSLLTIDLRIHNGRVTVTVPWSLLYFLTLFIFTRTLFSILPSLNKVHLLHRVCRLFINHWNCIFVKENSGFTSAW